MLDRDRADVPLRVEIENRVLVQIPRLHDRRVAELDQERVGICKAADLRGTNPLSKNALWTVTPSSSKITRK